MVRQDEVRLAVPARPEFLGLVRVTAAGLASRLGFTFDQVEDLRLAIDEISYGMTGSKGQDGILEVLFLLSPEGLSVRGQGHFSAPGQAQLSELSKVILDALVDEHSMSNGASGPSFLLVKSRTSKKTADGNAEKSQNSVGQFSPGEGQFSPGEGQFSPGEGQ